MPSGTPPATEAAVIAARRQLRAGPAFAARATGVAPRTVSRILARSGEPRLADCDPLTGQVIRASRHTAVRYEPDRPGELAHLDARKLGKVPGGGGWRSAGRAATSGQRHKKIPAGYYYVHAAIDDQARLAYAEILPDETGATAAEFLAPAAAHFAAAGIPAIERVITDNALACRRSTALRQAVTALGARQKFIRPHCPWQNGKIERLHRTLATEWAYRQPWTSNTERVAALTPWLEHDNNRRPHIALGGQPPISRLSSTRRPSTPRRAGPADAQR